MARGFKKSFYDWCIENNYKDWLELWDYELNGCNPKEVAYSSNKKYWFKCSRGIHKSEDKRLNFITSNKNYQLKCNQCNSFGQYLIDTYGENALERYWDYKMNKVNPFNITKCSHIKVWLFCQEVGYHESYEIRCKDFVVGDRCPYCSHKGIKIHPKDSFAQYHIDNTDKDFIEKYWSDKNTIDPFSIYPNSKIKVWIICEDENHDDYKISCLHFTKGQRCKKCKESKGEKTIRKYLDKHNINFVPQKEFSDLVGVSKWKPLSYDFYIPEQNLLIEYQGEYHDGTAKNQTEEDYLKQQEHDRRKREYAEQNGIRLLEIWYWDFDNIETILNKNIK